MITKRLSERIRGMIAEYYQFTGLHYRLPREVESPRELTKSEAAETVQELKELLNWSDEDIRTMKSEPFSDRVNHSILAKWQIEGALAFEQLRKAREF